MGLKPDRFCRHSHPGQRFVHDLFHFLVLQALERQSRNWFVERVANDGASQTRQLGSNLVFPSGDETYRGLVVLLAAAKIRNDRFTLDDFQDATSPCLGFS